MVHINRALLEQGIAVLDALSDEAYTEVTAAAFNATVGAHMRHCLDHYALFLHGVCEGRIDYTSRERDPRLEQDRVFARGAAQRLSGALGDLGENLPESLQVRLETGRDEGTSPGWGTSSTARELDYLVNHTVHHYAIIAVMLRMRGLDSPPGFGVAPSTLRHQRALDSCAR